MTVQAVVTSGIQKFVDLIAPDAQASTDVLTVLAGSAVDMRGWTSLVYTLKVATASIDWTVYGAHLADYSDEVVVQASATVAAAAVGSYSTAQAVWSRYRVKIVSTVLETPGTATLNGLAK